MRFVHTADWHLGKRLCEVSLLEDQVRAVEQVLQVCRSEGARALVIAGDVFDRSVPPEDAVRLWDHVVDRVARDLEIALVVVPGNHDSAERLSAHARLLERTGVHVRGSLARRAEPIVIDGVPVFALPYVDPERARLETGRDAIAGHDAAVRACLEDVRAAAAKFPASVLVAHLFARGGVESLDSERPLTVGTAGQVAADALAGFSYVALGHLHAPQSVGGEEAIRYSGSLLKYSFAEAAHHKGVAVVDVGRFGASVKHVPLSPARDLVRVRGPLEELLRHPRYAAAEGAYVEATYTDTTYVIEVADKLRKRFPHLLTVVPEVLQVEAPGGVKPREDDARALLTGFFEHVGLGAPNDALLAEFERVLTGAAADEAREVAA